MTAKQVIARLKADGWVEVRHLGSHKTFKHPLRTNLVTVPVHTSRDLHAGTLADIKRKAGW